VALPTKPPRIIAAVQMRGSSIVSSVTCYRLLARGSGALSTLGGGKIGELLLDCRGIAGAGVNEDAITEGEAFAGGEGVGLAVEHGGVHVHAAVAGPEVPLRGVALVRWMAENGDA